MTEAPDHHDGTAESQRAAHEPIRYPSDHLLAVLDRRDQVTTAVEALTAGGFLESEIQFGSGAANADDLGATTGRSGLVGLVTRLAERLDMANEEMESKNRYEQAMRENRFVVSVAAATDDRKDRAAQILREHGAHTIAFFGKHTIEYITPPNGT
jgi:hypothetical protein